MSDLTEHHEWLRRKRMADSRETCSVCNAGITPQDPWCVGEPVWNNGKQMYEYPNLIRHVSCIDTD